jgi:trimeric autotransporter adhesin
MSSLRRTLAALAALASWSCSSTEPSATTPVADIVVNPPTSTLALNTQLPLQALVRNEAGELVPDASVTWTVENPAIASVSTAGVVTALALGSTQVAANARGKSGLASITVAKTPVSSVVLLPDRVSTSIGTTTKLTATAYDAGQNVLPDRGFVWTTSDAAVATVDNGLVTTKAQGTATITATAEGKSDATVFTVSPGAVAKVSITPSSISMVVGDKQTLTASAQDASGTVLTGRTVTWASANTQAVTVGANGEITAVSAGSAHITATIDGVSGAADVTVTRVPVQSVTVGAATLMVGQKTTLVATVRDARGTVVTDRTVTWSMPANAFASINPATGEVTGLAPGSVQATASVAAEGKSGSATVTVVPVPPAPVATVSIDKASPSIVQNASTTLTATTKDAAGNTLSGRAVTWQTSDAGIASLSATSGSSVQVTGGVAGTATITATSEGQSTTSTVTVTPGTVNKVQLTLQNTTLKKNQTTIATAVVFDNNNQPLQGRVVTWTATSAATIAPSTSTTSSGANSAATATVTAKNAVINSSSTITASSGGKNDSKQLTVTP